jgi:hypothetical protein
MSTIMVKKHFTADQLLSRTAQQSDFMMGSALVFDADDAIAAVKDHAGGLAMSSAVKASSGGVLEVHFVNSWNADGTPAWYLMTLIGGDKPTAAMIDYVRSTNSTVTMANVEFIL